MNRLRHFGRKSVKHSGETNSASAANPTYRNVEHSSSPEDLFKALALRLANELEGVDRALPVADDFALRVWTADENEHLTYLRNIFAETRELSPADRKERLRGFLSLMTDRTEQSEELQTWEAARMQLRPVVRCVDLLLGDVRRIAVVHRGFAPCLCEAIALDLGASLRYVVKGDLASWSVTEDEVFAAAHENLTALELSVIPYADAGGPLQCLTGEDDTYLSSYALSIAALRGIAQAAGGELVFAIPHRSLFVACLREDAAAVAQLAAVTVREYEASPRSASPELYVLDGDQVRPLIPTFEHESYESLTLARLQFRGSVYNRQKGQLEARLKAENQDWFVATVSGIETDKRIYSYCVWGENVPTLLPETDLVFLNGGEGPERWHFAIAWSDLLEVAGACLVPSVHAGLTRFRTVAWLTPEQIERLRARRALG